MNLLWLYHYALIQKLAKKRYRNFQSDMSLSAFVILTLFFIGLFVVFVDKAWFSSLYHGEPRLPWAQIIKVLLLVVFAPLYIYFAGNYKFEDKVSKLRKIVVFRNQVSRKVSICYVCSIFIIFILGFIFITFNIPVY